MAPFGKGTKREFAGGRTFTLTLGNAGVVASRTGVPPRAGESTYTELGVETGVLGLAAFVGWLAASGQLANTFAQEKKPEPPKKEAPKKKAKKGEEEQVSPWAKQTPQPAAIARAGCATPPSRAAPPRPGCPTKTSPGSPP
mgnify:CR=1 FL=1